VYKFFKILGEVSKSWAPEGRYEKVTYRGFKNVRFCCTKFSPHRRLMSDIFFALGLETSLFNFCSKCERKGCFLCRIEGRKQKVL